MSEMQFNTRMARMEGMPADPKPRARFAVGSFELPGLEEPDFNTFFRHVPGIFVVTDSEFTIAAASDDMLRKTFTWRQQIIARSVLAVFPRNPFAGSPDEGNKLETLLREVMSNGTSCSRAVLRHDMQNRLGDGGWIEKYWTVVCRPVIDRRTNSVLYVMTEGRDVTRIVNLALWLGGRGVNDELAPDIQRTVQRVRRDAMSQAPHLDRVRERIDEEMKLTGATPDTLVAELKALLRSPENRLYACAGEWVTESGVYVAYHRGGCLFAPRVRYFAEGVQFPSCASCGNDVLYRLSRTLS